MKKQDIPILKIEDSDKKLEDYELEEIREIDEHLKKYSHDHKMYVRCLAVKMVILGETRKKVGEFLEQRIMYIHIIFIYCTGSDLSC